MQLLRQEPDWRDQAPGDGQGGNPVRIHESDCKNQKGCRCEIVYVDKVVMPSERALEYELDRLDPVGRVEEPMPELPGRTKAEIEAEGARYWTCSTAA
jgi:hypothetical protein